MTCSKYPVDSAFKLRYVRPNFVRDLGGAYGSPQSARDDLCPGCECSVFRFALLREVECPRSRITPGFPNKQSIDVVPLVLT